MRKFGLRWPAGKIARLAGLALIAHAASAAFGPTASADASKPAAAPSPTVEEQLYELAPFAIQIVNLASYDPVMAASLVPEPWVDSLAESALALEAEVASKPRSPRPAPSRWPIGPWPSSERLAETIDRVDPGAVASLYKALRPRLRSQCSARGVSHERCETAIRTSVRTLSAARIQDRAVGKPSSFVTPTQEQLAGLGRPVAFALRGKLIGLHRAIWGVALEE